MSCFTSLRCGDSGSSRCRADLRGEAVPGREVLVRQGLAERLDRPIILLGPVATLARAGDLDPGRIAVFPHDAGPVVRRSRSSGPEIDPADQGCIRGERGLDLLQRGRLAGEGPVPGLQRLLEFQESSPQAARLIPELLEPSVVVLGSSRIGGELADLLIEPLQLPQEIGLLAPLFRGQGAELTGREIVEQAPCEVRFPGSPGIPVLMLAGRSEGEGGQRVDSRRLGSLESRTAHSPSTPLDAFGSGSSNERRPPGAGLEHPGWSPGCCSCWRCRGGPRPAPCGRCPGPSGRGAGRRRTGPARPGSPARLL